MARAELPRSTGGGKFPTTLATATMTAANVADGNSVRCTGREWIVFRNSSTDTAYTVTVDSQPINGRSGDLTAISIPAAGVRFLEPLSISGWRQSDGTVHINASNAAILIAVLDPG